MQDGASAASLVVGPDDTETARNGWQQPAEPRYVEIVAGACCVTLLSIGRQSAVTSSTEPWCCELAAFFDKLRR